MLERYGVHLPTSGQGEVPETGSLVSVLFLDEIVLEITHTHAQGGIVIFALFTNMQAEQHQGQTGTTSADPQRTVSGAASLLRACSP